ncbi:MAG: gliding motility-associated C-terminal domain-containing protein [Bacteroidia bacterium]|nr:gliding motility-associated C-terminal domain-containing protein [Bacteroidia bacterium]
MRPLTKPNWFKLRIYIPFVVLHLTLFTSTVYAQKQANIWYFGNKAGLDFNYSPPKALTNSAMNTAEGCASVADGNGKLLFYTDGITIWDKTHSVMKNGSGLKGHYSSAQSAVIVPKPGSNTNYYIFTVDGSSGRRQGCHYNEVDISKNGGNGEVILKNQVLINWSGYLFESIGATSHANGRDFWVCYADRDSSLKSFLVSFTGVQTTPVVSKPGNIHTGNSWSFYMKFSSDNKYMAYTPTRKGLRLVQFDDQTGKFKKAITIDNSPLDYGMEFSPNSKLLYTSRGYQYDISSFDSATIAKSKYFYNGGTNYYQAIQLGPDGRMYTAAGSRGGTSKIGFIGQPNKKGSGCQFYPDTIDVGGRMVLGLPTFLQSYLDPNFNVKGTCYGDTTHFLVTETKDLDSVTWYLGDSTVHTALRSDTIRYGHLYKKPGEYDTKTIFYFKDRSDTIARSILIRDFLATGEFLGEDLLKCRGDTVKINLNNWTFEGYQWSTGDSTKEVLIDSPGVYWVQAFPEFKCFYTDTIRVVDYSNDEIPGELHLGKDKSKCPVDTIRIQSKESFKRYVWSTGDTTNVLTTVDSGSYVVKGYNHDVCFSSDTIHVAFHPGAYPNLGPDSSHCYTADAKIRVGDLDNSFDTYTWNNGSTDPFLFTDTSGLFVLEVSNKYGCIGIDSVHISITNGTPDIDLGDNQLFCDSLPVDSFLLVKNTGGKAVYTWGDGSLDTSKIINRTGWYHLKAKNVCGTDSDSVEVVLHERPELELPANQDTLFCDSIRSTLAPIISGTKPDLLWSTGDTSSLLAIKQPGTYHLKATNQCGVDSLKATIRLVLTPDGTPFGDSSFCKPINQHYQLKRKDSMDQYTWSLHGAPVSEADTLLINSSGSYNLIITNHCGVYRDTFNVKELTIPKVDLGPDIDACDSVRHTLSADISNNEESLLWSTGDFILSVTLTQVGEYWLRARNKCGEEYDTVAIRLHHKVTPNLPTDTLVCDNTSHRLDATIKGDHNSYNWSTGESTPIIEVSQDGVYKVEIENACTTYTMSQEVLFLKLPVQILTPGHVYCDTVSTTELTAGLTNNDETYHWSNNQETRSIQVDEAGLYWVDVSNGCGTTRDSTEIRISISPEVNLGEDTSLCGEFVFELDAGNPGMQYLWKPTGEQTHTILADKQQEYSVVVTNADGCQGHDRFEITDECRARFYLPGAFSPNGDNLNDVFKPNFVTNVDQYHMEIFNRWGELMFVSDQLEEGWDGSYQGEECPIGLYTVLIKYYNHEKGGFERGRRQITLLR